MKNLQVRGRPRLSTVHEPYMYKVARFREVRKDPLKHDSQIRIYPEEGEFFILRAKLFPIKLLPWDVNKRNHFVEPILKIMEGVILVNSILIASSGTEYISIKCDTVTKTIDDAKAYLVAKELMQ